MKAFDPRELWQEQLGYGHEERYHSLTEIREHLEPDEAPQTSISARMRAGDRSATRRGAAVRACSSSSARSSTPFFKLMVWSDDAGWQRIKWSTSPVVTPFINVAEAKLPYFDSLKLARRLVLSQPDVPSNGVSVMTSPNTGEKLTVFWRALPPLDGALLVTPAEAGL